MLLAHEAVPFNTFVVPYPATNLASTPSSADLTGYRRSSGTPGEAYRASQLTMTPAQQAILEAWLDQGNHTLVIFSQNISTISARPTGSARDEHLPGELRRRARLLGRRRRSPQRDLQRDRRDRAPFASEIFQVITGQPLASTGDVINPAPGTDTLATVVENPDNSRRARAGRHHRRPQVGRRRAQLEVVYAGMPIQNVLMTVGNNTAQQLFHAALVYTGLKTQ